jgi:hypothetical protein
MPAGQDQIIGMRVPLSATGASSPAMEQFIAAAIAELLKYGLPGLVILYLIFENRQIKQEKEAAEKRIDALQQDIKEMFEKRVDEAIKTVTTLGATSAGSETMGEAINALAKAVGVDSERWDELKEKLQTIFNLLLKLTRS